MKNAIIYFSLLGLLLNCTQATNSKKQKLLDILSRVYSLEDEGLTSLSFQVTGNHETLKNFLKNVPVDSPQIYIYWKAPFDLKTVIKNTRGKSVSIPRWLDFGFAFGILYGPDLHPIIRTPKNELDFLEQEFKPDQSATIEFQTDKNQNPVIILKSNDHTNAFQKYLLNRNNFLLSRSGSRIVNRQNQLIENGYMENWLRLPNGKIVVSQSQKSYKDRTQLQIRNSIRYLEFDHYWLPVEIIEKRRAIDQGRVYKIDTRLVYSRYQINPAIPDSLFQFRRPAEPALDFLTPEGTMNSFIHCLKAGNTARIRECFSPEMRIQFDTHSREISQQITPFPLIPAARLKQVQTDVLQWAYSNYTEKLNAWEIEINEKGKDMAEAMIQSQNLILLSSGPYQLVRKNETWQIDSNPYVIFRAKDE